MLPCLARAACLALALLAGPAMAGDLTDFNAAVEQAQSHNRVAVGYLRTGNVDLASLEIDRRRKAWGALAHRFAGKRPDAFDGIARYGTLWTGGSAHLVAADLMLKSGRPHAARQPLDPIRGDLYDLRMAAGIAVLADCVRDANAAMDALMLYNDRALDWTKSQTRFGIANKASIYGSVLERGGGWGGGGVRTGPKSRRLVGGPRAGRGLIPK